MGWETFHQNLQLTLFLLACFLLACTPLSQLSRFNPGETSPAPADEVGLLEAYDKLRRLPGYRLESQSIVRDELGHLSKLMIISEQDRRGNSHIMTFTPEGQEVDMIVVDGRTYIFETRYQGWIDLADETAAGVKGQGELYSSSLKQIMTPLRLMAQIGALPAKIGQETMQERPVTRYQLQNELPEEGNQDSRSTSLEVEGAFWVDEATGALLKSELLLYENKARQPTQELLLLTTQIGQVQPITLPAPIVSPGAVIAATATAQAWSTFPVKLDYREKAVTFEILPLKTAQNSETGRVEVRLRLRQLPAELFALAQVEPFLDDLQQKLQLSLPEHNLLIPSDEVRLEELDAQGEIVEVTFFFKANLAEFQHVELVLAASGNPLLVTVPVEGEE